MEVFDFAGCTKFPRGALKISSHGSQVGKPCPRAYFMVLDHKSRPKSYQKPTVNGQSVKIAKLSNTIQQDNTVKLLFNQTRTKHKEYTETGQ